MKHFHYPFINKHEQAFAKKKNDRVITKGKNRSKVTSIPSFRYSIGWYRKTTWKHFHIIVSLYKYSYTITSLCEKKIVCYFYPVIKIFNRLVQQDRMESQGSEVRHFVGGPSINIQVRRSYLYEDAFDRLSQDNGMGMK